MGTRRSAWTVKMAGAACVLVAPWGCGDPSTGPGPPAAGAGIELSLVAEGFRDPVHVTAPPGDPRLFVVEQAGVVRIVRDGVVAQAPFLDLRDRVVAGGERGLLSIAFDPDFERSGHVWVSYTGARGESRLSRFAVGPDPDVADESSELRFLTVAQPFSNHNGGHIAFAPDGTLFFGLGDGGSGGDPLGSGQDRGTLLGSLLRLEVRAGPPAVAPADNPFVGVPGVRPEIWAYGLRNPWRFAIDDVSGHVFIGDVGQARVEEIDAVPFPGGGANLGWNVREGDACFESSTCASEGFVDPVSTYDHSEGCSVIGGVVVRGGGVPELEGWYVFSDLCSGWIRRFRFDDGRATDLEQLDLNPLSNPTSFGLAADGTLHVVTGAGELWRFVSAPTGG